MPDTAKPPSLPSAVPEDIQAAHDSVPRAVLEHVVDVHCHPTDSDMGMTLGVAQEMAIRTCAMATRRSDQQLVAALARAHPEKVIPCFGYHPWFAHWISVTEPTPSKEAHYRSLFLPPSPPPKATHVSAFDRLLPFLPEPIPLAEVIADLHESLSAFPNAMLGEVGLDRACRIPYSRPADPPYAEGEDGPRELSPFTIPLGHQLHVLEAQLDLAVRLRRNVSLHSVKCQQATVELLDRMEAKHPDDWFRISVDLHSCGLSAQGWTAISKRHPNAFLSLSTAINGRAGAHTATALIAACAPDRLLVESDYHDIRRAAPYTWHMLRTVAAVRGWSVEDRWDAREGEWGAVRRLEENWKAFERGGHRPYAKRRQGRDRAIEEWEEANESEPRGRWVR